MIYHRLLAVVLLELDGLLVAGDDLLCRHLWQRSGGLGLAESERCLPGLIMLFWTHGYFGHLGFLSRQRRGDFAGGRDLGCGPGGALYPRETRPGVSVEGDGIS